MSSSYDWRNQFYGINKIDNLLNLVSNEIEAINKLGNMKSILETRNILSSSYASSAINSALGNLEKLNSSNVLRDTLTALENIEKINSSNGLRNTLSAFRGFGAIQNSIRRYNTIQNTFSRLDWSNAIKIPDILKEVTEQYIKENDIDEIASEEIREVVEAKDGKLLTERQRHLWQVYIYPLLASVLSSLLVSLLFFILSSKQQQSVRNNSLVEVNNYYIIEAGMEANTLNDCNFRMICTDNVIPRIKTDCSSQVVGYLSLGKVVCIADKHKKWIKITWKDYNGEYYSGWIQNYKVIKFK